MRKLLLVTPFLMLSLGCGKTPVGPGSVKITESTTSTTTTTTVIPTTTTIPLPTVSSFVFSPITPEIAQVVNFNGAGSTPGTNRTIVAYDWDFGDGVMKTGVTATHDFFPVGIYLVTLTVTDNTGQKVSSAQPITVRPIVP